MPATPSVSVHRPARSALLLALAGFAILSVGDAVVKSMAGQWPAPAVSALRYTFGAIGLATVVAIRHGRAGFVLPRPGLQVGRAAAVSVATICFFVGVMVMPLADTTAIQFTSPIFTALLAPFVLGERTTRATWIATLVAFAGVLVVLRPNLYELGLVALFPVGAAVGMSWLMMFNRKAAGAAPMWVMQFLVAVLAAPMLIAAAFLLAWAGLIAVAMPSAIVVAKCFAVAISATVAHALIFAAVERVDASVVAPMTYVQLLVAVFLGWTLFGDVPDAVGFGGAALIIAGGLLLWRAQRVKDLGEAPS